MSDLIHNERLKLTAGVLNTMASGLVITGVVAPAVAVIYGVPGPAQAGGLLLALASAFWLAGGATLHILARAALGGLKG
jgi:hypothetical protein